MNSPQSRLIETLLKLCSAVRSIDSELACEGARVALRACAREDKDLADKAAELAYPAIQWDGDLSCP